GAAALLADVARATLPAADVPQAIDGRVLKAVLMNAAVKTVGWNNGQALVSGTWTTTQSLDFTVGTGRLNVARAYTQYTGGTRNVPGLGGGTVASAGWDYGQVNRGSFTDYAISSQLIGGSELDTTLTWFVNRSID